MVLLKRLLLWSICLHGLILISLGHGGGFLFFVDLFALVEFTEFVNERNFNPLTLGSAHNMGFIVLLSFFGKLFAIIALFIKRKKRFLILSFIGLIQLWLSYLYLSYHFTSDNAAYTAFITGLPFLLVSLLFIVFACYNETIKRSVYRP